MNVAHVAYTEQSESSTEMARFESRRLSSEVFMGGRELHRWNDNEFFGLWIYLLHRHNGHESVRCFDLQSSQIISIWLGKWNATKAAAELITMLYSGFSHFCFWQCSANILTGSFPVHDAPPMTSFTDGFLGSSVAGFASPAFSATALACFVPGLGPPFPSPFFLGGIFGSIVASVQQKSCRITFGAGKRATRTKPFRECGDPFEKDGSCRLHVAYKSSVRLGSIVQGPCRSLHSSSDFTSQYL